MTISFKRLLLRLYDGAGLVFAVLFLQGCFPASAWAYIDPSVMTYTIQAVAGVAVAISAVVGVLFRRGRRKIEWLLDIDGDAKLIREGDVHRVVPQEAPREPLEEPEMALADEVSQKGKSRFFDRSAGGPPWKQRCVFGTIVALFFVFTIFFVSPIEIVEGSSSSLVFGVGELWGLLVLPALGMVVFIAAILTALRGRAFAVALAVVFALGLCAYIQALVLNGGLPAADGATIFWGDYMAMQVVSTILWVAILAICIVYGLHRRRRGQGIAVLLSGFLVVVQAVGLVSLALPSGSASTMDEPRDIPARSSDRRPASQEVVTTEEGLYALDEENNVILFVLDTFDDAYLRRIEKQDPALLDEFTGFTAYRNCTGSMIPTRFAVPQMLTGQMPQEGEAFSVYKAERYNRGTFLDSLAQANYSIGLYTDALTVGELPIWEQRAVTDKTINIHGLDGGGVNWQGALYSLYQMALYRDAPWSLKWAFWYYTDQINAALVAFDPAAAPEETIYVIDDPRYFGRLKSIGLSVDANDSFDGAFRFIHLLGSHYPFSYDENGEFLGEDESDVFRQTRGAVAIVSEYLRQMKSLGLYDDATIIVTADHGYWTITEEGIKQPSNPVMFVKPLESAEEAAKPLVTDDKPVSSLDLQATILDAMGLDWSEYANREAYPGFSMLGPIDQGRKRYYLTTDSLPDLTETRFREYLIDGDARDFSHWTETGRFIDAQT